MSKTLQIDLDHALGVDGAVVAMERACRYYSKKYPETVISWEKLTSTSVEVKLCVIGVIGLIRGEAEENKLCLSMDIPDDTNIPEMILKVYVRKEAAKWLS